MDILDRRQDIETRLKAVEEALEHIRRLLASSQPHSPGGSISTVDRVRVCYAPGTIAFDSAGRVLRPTPN